MLAIVTIVTSCQKEKLTWVESSIPEGVDVKKLDMWSYDVPIGVKSNGEWKTEITGDWFYLLPESGSGDATIQICVLDNNTEQRQNGTIKIVTKDGNSSVIEIQQKSAADYDENLSMVDKGYAKYAVGYGYNALKGIYPSPKCLTKQIVKFSDLYKDDKISFDPSVSAYKEKTITGSSFEELSNKLNITANLNGKYGGFKGEVSASFGMNNYSSGNHEFAMTYIDYEIGVISLEPSIEELKAYLTSGAKNAINGVGEYSDATALVKDYGTHLLVKAKAGGKLRQNMAVDITRVTGVYDLHAYAKASYSSFGISADASVTDELKTSYTNNQKNCDFSFTAYGGDSNGLTVSSAATAITAWKNSLSYDNYNLSLIDIESEYLVPLQDLITLGAGKKEERAKAIEIAIETLKTSSGSMLSSGAEVKLTIPDFSATKVTGTLVKTVSTEDGNEKAIVCHEYIPMIDKINRVTVIYPVINNVPRFNLGYFIGNASHKPARVSWTGNVLHVKEYDQQAFGVNSEVYIKGASVSATQSTEKVFPARVTDRMLYARYNAYPLVKILGNIWTRVNYREGYRSDGVDVHPWWSGNEQVGHCYDINSISSPIFAPTGWRVAESGDFKGIETELTNRHIDNIGGCFRQNGLLGFEAPVVNEPTISYWYIIPTGGGAMTSGAHNEYMTADGCHVRILDGVFVTEPIYAAIYRMPIRLVMR